jgi:DNA replication protein DnaC
VAGLNDRRKRIMPIDDCLLCRGTGWQMIPRRDGAGLAAVPCDCGMVERASRIMDRARVPKRYEHCDFESYSTDVGATAAQTQSLKNAMNVTKGFVQNYPMSAEKGLLLTGASGVGKTHLAVAALKELIARGHAGLFCDYRELLKEIQASYNPSSESTEMSILEPVRTVEILVMDDLGASKPSVWVLDIIGLVLNARYNERRVTILTTNYFDEPEGAPEAIKGPDGKRVSVREDTIADRIGARMRSRLFEMCRTVNVEAPDFRREVRQSGRAGAR